MYTNAGYFPGTGSPGEGGDITKILATDVQYNLGTSTTLAPTVKQVKTDLTGLSSRISTVESLVTGGDLDLSNLATQDELDALQNQVDALVIPDVSNLVTNDALLLQLNTKADTTVVESMSDKIAEIENTYVTNDALTALLANKVDTDDIANFVTNDSLLTLLNSKADTTTTDSLEQRILSIETSGVLTTVPYATATEVGGCKYTIKDNTMELYFVDI